MSDSYLNFNSNKTQFSIVHVIYQENKKIEKTIDLQNKILLNDTIEDVLNKIAIKSKLITGDFIYAWMEHKKQIYPLFVSYDKINLINPYFEKTYDNHFVYDDGTKKQDYQQTLHSFQIIESFINQNKLTSQNTQCENQYNVRRQAPNEPTPPFCAACLSVPARDSIS